MSCSYKSIKSMVEKEKNMTWWTNSSPGANRYTVISEIHSLSHKLSSIHQENACFWLFIPYQFKSQHPNSITAILLWYCSLYYSIISKSPFIYSQVTVLTSYKCVFVAPLSAPNPDWLSHKMNPSFPKFFLWYDTGTISKRSIIFHSSYCPYIRKMHVPGT